MSRSVDLLTELIRLPSVGSGEGAVAQRCAALLEEAGFRTEFLSWEDGRDQLAARSPDGNAAPLTLTGHLDTVPADPAGWKVDPWAAERDGDRIVGRGTSDMKSGVASAIVATVEHARRPHACRGVQIVLTAGEETGCTGALRIRGDALGGGGPLLVAEPTGNRLVPAHKGAHWMRLIATGRAAHGSAPELGDNAVVRLARAAVALHDYAEWPRSDRFGAVTANVGVLRGGVQPNVVPDTAELLLDVRTVPEVDGDELRSLVSTVAGAEVQVADHVVLPPVDTALDDPFIALVRESLSAVGLDDSPSAPARYFTDASVLAGLLAEPGGGTPTVILGPGETEQCHVVDEWCLASRVERATELYVDLLDRWCRRG